MMDLEDMFRDSLKSIAMAPLALTSVRRQSIFIKARHTNLRKQLQNYTSLDSYISHLGGLLSTYALSGETLLLMRADDLAKLLLSSSHPSSESHFNTVDPTVIEWVFPSSPPCILINKP